MKVIILVGGLGTRLKEVIKDIPKPMAQINKKPFLSYIMDNMINYGATEFILCVGHKRECIIDYFKDLYQDISVKYSVEEILLGTGGAIKQAFEMFKLDEAVVINGDTFVKMNYAEFYNQMIEENLGVALKEVDDASRYGLVKTEGNRIIDFTEKSDSKEAGYINAGIYYIKRELFKKSLPEKFSFEKEILEKEVKELKPKFFKTENYFIDIGIPESYAKACIELPEVVYE